MPILEMKVPSPGESISEVEIADWLVSDGDYVEKDQAIAEVDSDKATLELPAEEAGIITLKAEVGDTVDVGAVVCLIDTDAKAPAKAKATAPAAAEAPKVAAPKAEAAPVPTPAPAPEKESYAKGHPSPAAAKLMTENGVKANQVSGTGKDGRITQHDVVAAMAAGFDSSATAGWGGTRDTKNEKMSMLRRKVAERLVAVKNETAMLTTFNEIDMKPIMDMRKQYKDKFREVHGVNLGFMSFFTKAVTEALNLYPAVNAMIEGKEAVFHDYADIGIAVS